MYLATKRLKRAASVAEDALHLSTAARIDLTVIEDHLYAAAFSYRDENMGYVKIKATVGSPDKARLREVEFLADSGSWYMVLPPSIAGELKLSPVATRSLVLADGRKLEAPLVVVYVRALDSESIALAAVAEPPEPLLGTSTMEDLGIVIDPTTGEARKVRAAGLMLTIHKYATDRMTPTSQTSSLDPSTRPQLYERVYI